MAGMDFGKALAALKNGDKVARPGWNGKGMHVCLQPERMDGGEVFAAHLVMRTPAGVLVPWVTSQADVLAEDWQIKEEN